MKQITVLLFGLLLTISPLFAQEEPATPFSVRDLEGKRFKLEDLKGNLVVLNFWFVQCKPCVQEMPELNELVQKHQDENVIFLAFALNGKPELTQFLKKKTFSYHIVPDARAVAEDYGVEGYPTHLVIDPAGNIVYSAMGFGPDTVEKLGQEIEGLLAER